MSTGKTKPKTDQYQMRLPSEFREQLETEMKKDGDTTLATWIKRVLRKELQSRGIDPKG
jgi:predicted DNA-binding protein